MAKGIIELSSVIQGLNPDEILTKKTLELLLQKGATATEAAITLHLIYEIPLEDAGNFVIASNLFPFETPNDTMYFTFEYMHYDGNVS